MTCPRRPRLLEELVTTKKCGCNRGEGRRFNEEDAKAWWEGPDRGREGGVCVCVCFLGGGGGGGN